MYLYLMKRLRDLGYRSLASDDSLHVTWINRCGEHPTCRVILYNGDCDQKTGNVRLKFALVVDKGEICSDIDVSTVLSHELGHSIIRPTYWYHKFTKRPYFWNWRDLYIFFTRVPLFVAFNFLLRYLETNIGGGSRICSDLFIPLLFHVYLPLIASYVLAPLRREEVFAD